MHGRKRAEYKARLNDPKLAAVLATKATQWHSVTAELLKRRMSSAAASTAVSDRSQADPGQPQDAYSIPETLKVIEKALLVNPDPLYLWSQRRGYLLEDLKTLFDVTTENRLTQGALERNPKAYGPWFHRKWTLQQQSQLLICLPTQYDDVATSRQLAPQQQFQLMEESLHHELALSAKFLSLDERNFHCWNYRRFIVALLWHNDSQTIDMCRLDGSLEAFVDIQTVTVMGPQTGRIDSTNQPVLQAKDTVGGSGKASGPSVATTVMTERQQQLISNEWAFTQFKIQENFSNGSAFHYRSKLLPLMVVIRGNGEDLGVSVEEQMLQEELELVKNAMFTEPDDQTAWWYMVFLLDWAAESRQKIGKLPYILQDLKDAITELVQAEDDQTKWGLLGLHTVLDHLNLLAPEENLKTEMNSILDKLQALDPDRSNRYESMKLPL